MQRIDPGNAKPKRIMLVLDATRYEFIMESSKACLSTPTQFLRSLISSDMEKQKKLTEINREGTKDFRINLILPDNLNKALAKKTEANNLTKAGYMRSLIDCAMG